MAAGVLRVDQRVERGAELRDERRLQACGGLALRSRNLGERLAGVELRLELVVGQAQVLRGRVLEARTVAVPTAAGAEPRPVLRDLRRDSRLRIREDLRLAVAR